jgi:membrane-associated protease RseP (regulator of RpoE activity)
VSAQYGALGFTALFRRVGEEDVVLAIPGVIRPAASRTLLPILLFGATFLSVLFAGSNLMPDEIFAHPFRLIEGWPFAVSLLGILLAHELGHYFMGRRLGMPSSLPYFIPFPISIFGTMGAVIQLKAPPPSKRHLLAVASAGPLAGLIVAIPLLFLGLHLSEVGRIPPGMPIFQEGNSLLYAGLKFLAFGRFLPSGGQDVFLHPVALAGWAGLLVTSLNLIPVGQLDGGHVTHSLIGRHARWLPWIVIAALLGLSLLWQGWLIWVGLVFIFGRQRAEPLDDITPLRSRERGLAILLLVVAVLIFTPIPMTL